MMTILSGIRHHRSQRGFSAVEIIAVATIMAILALILIPILTRQVAKSREAAVRDELSNLAKVITIAYAETDRYFRLQDFDNLSIYFPDRIEDPTQEVPVTYAGFLGRMTDGERARLANIWDGPRTNFQNSASLQEIYATRPEAFTLLQAATGQLLGPVGGPIVMSVVGADPLAPAPLPPTLDERLDRYPLDPWGNPYLFFPAGPLIVPGIAAETEYVMIHANVLYSLGPDGLPGNNPLPSPRDYYPVPGSALGSQGTDDIMWRF